MELFNKEIKYRLNGKSLSAYHRCLQTLHQISIRQICHIRYLLHEAVCAGSGTGSPAYKARSNYQRFIEAVWLWEYPLFLVLCLNK